MNLSIIHEDNHLLVVDKPAGLLAQGDRSGDPTLNDLAKEYLRRKYHKPGNIYLGLVHRLDRNVSGVVVLARTSKAASRLSAAFREKTVQKTYRALVHGCPASPAGSLTAWLAKEGDRQGVTRAAEHEFDGARECLLRYRVLERSEERSLLEVIPITGRRHQIRAQLALIGCPLLGDVKYGAPRPLPGHRVALHAFQLAFNHPVGGAPVRFQAPLPADWPGLRQRRRDDHE